MSENTSSTVPSLASVLAKTVSPSVWVEFKEGIKFQLRYLPKAKFRSLADQNTELIYDEKRKTRIPKLNGAAFTKAFVASAVLGWSGVTLRSLSRISEIDLADYPADQLDTEMPYSAEEMSKLLDLVYDLDGFVNEAVMDIRTFRPLMESETKNSKTSQATS